MIRWFKRILEWYLGVPAAQPGQDTQWDFSYDWPWPSWIPLWAALPPVILLAAFVIWVYLRDALTASARMRLGLIGLRLTTIVLLCLFLTNITLSVDGTELPVVVVMIDRSASMSLDDHYTDKEVAATADELMADKKGDERKASRLNLAKAILSRDGGRFFKELQREHRLHVYEFSGAAAPFDQGEFLLGDEVDKLLPRLKTELHADGEQTGFLTSLKRVFEDFDDTRPAAVILLTDGIATAGETERMAAAAKLAENHSVPLYTIVLGSKEPARDLEISGLIAPDVAFMEAPITFSADLKAFGLKDEEIRVRLRRKGEVAALREIRISKTEDGKPQRVHITYTPRKEGENDFILEAVPVANETNTANNAQTVHVSVRRESLKVLLADYVPRYEFRFLKHLLERQKSIELHTILQDADDEFTLEDETAKRSFPKDRKELFRYDVIVLGDVDAKLIPPDVLTNLFEFVRSGRSVVMIAGPYHNPMTYADTPLKTLLPIDLEQVKVPPEDETVIEEFRPALTSGGKRSTIFRLSNDDKDNAGIWNALPKLRWFVEAHQLKPGATVLAEHPTRQTRPNGGIERKTPSRPLPIIAMHHVGAGKVMFHATDELWRWRRLVGDLYYGRYWIQTIRYLCRSKLVGKSRAAELETNRKEYTQGESVQITLRFFEDKEAPVDDDGVTIFVERVGHANRRVKLKRVPNQPLVFRGDIPRIAEGTYRAWVESPVFKAAPPASSFLVKPPQRELRNRSLDPSELTALSEGIHGGWFTIAEAADVPRRIPPGIKTPLNQPHSVPLWNRWELMLLFAGWVVVFVFCAVLIAGWIDWYWHVEGNLRLALALLTMAGVGWLSWRLLVRPLMHALSNVELAIKIERRYPGFRDSLASTVQFQNEQANPRLGSPELQRRVIEETMPRLESVDLDAVIEQRGVRRAASTAFGVSLLMLLIVAFNQTEAATAVRRLLFPYSAGDWDRETRLQLLDDKLEPIRHEPGQPFRRVQGDTFRVYVENMKGDLPEDTVLEVKDPDGEIVREKLRRLTVRDKRDVVHRLGTANLLLERGPMFFRAVGGDDRDMSWHRLEVVPAPRVESIRVTLIPPKYTGRKQETLPAGVGHIRALVGTEVRIDVKSHTPLQFARLRVKSDPPREVKLDSDGRSFQARFRLVDHGNYSYWFDLKDRQGFDNPNAPRYDIRAIRDRLPTVRMVRPPRNVRVTKNAVVPVKVIAEDDLKLRDVRIRFRSSVDPDGRYEVIPLDDPAQTYRWRMDQLKKIVEGVQIRFHVDATDHFNLDKDGRPDPDPKPKHIGKSLTRILTIVTPEEKADEIARNYGALLEELSRVAKQQQQAYDDVTQLALQLAKAGKLRADRDLPLLRRVERSQREINVRLAEADGVEQRANGLTEELRNNRIDAPELSRRLTIIAAELAELRRHHLPGIEADLTTTRKSADDEIFDPSPDENKPRSTDPAQQRQRLQNAQRGQRVVLKSLNKLISDLREWRNWQNLSTDLEDLIKTQESLHQKSLILKAATLGLRTVELKKQQKADLAKLAEGQRRISDRLNRFNKDIGGFLNELGKQGDQSPSTTRILTDAAEFLRAQQLEMRMGELARQIDANQLGSATSAQEKLIDDMREIKAILENRGASDLETLIKQQKDAENELAGLEKRQEELLRKTQQAAQMTNRERKRDELKKLAKQQEDLRKNLNQMASRLRRLLAIRANDAARRAAQSMERSARSFERDDLTANQDQQRETLEHLEQARRELARTRAQAEEQLARELLERIADELRGIDKRQQNVIDETERLQKEYKRAGNWSRGRLITLDTTQEEQLALRAKVQSLAQKTQAAEVFSLVLRNIAELMQSAALDLAASRETPASLEKSVEQQRAIKERIVKLLATLAAPAAQPGNAAATPAGAKGSRQQRQELISRIAQWKLLKSLQEDALKQTKALHETRKSGTPLTEAQKKTVEGLSNEQSGLADRAASLSSRRAQLIPLPAGKTDPQINLADEAPILPEKKTPAKTDSLDELQRRITAGMRSAAGRLAEGKTGDDTQTTQQQVIADIEKLIRQAEKQLANSTGGTPKSVPSGNAKTQPKNGKKPPNGQKTPAKGANSKRGKENKRPKDSTKGTRDPEKAKQTRIRVDRRNRMIRQRWGHLPERERQRLRNVNSDNSLPKYKPQINRFLRGSSTIAGNPADAVAGRAYATIEPIEGQSIRPGRGNGMNGTPGLHLVDWILIAVYASATIGLGVYFSRRQNSTEEYFVGSGNMNPLLIGISLFATLLSTISYLSMPGEAAGKGPVGMVGMLAFPFVYIIVAYWVLPIYMRQRVTSAYELLEERLGLSVRMLGATMFLALRLVWMTLLVYAAAKAMTEMINADFLILNFEDWTVESARTGERDIALSGIYEWKSPVLTLAAIPVVVLITGIVSIIYTTLGGLRAVVITDLMQTILLFGGALLVIVMVSWDFGGFSWFPTSWQDNWDTQPIVPTDPKTRLTVVGTLLTTVTWYIATSAGDQTSVQRFMATRDASTARKALATQLTVGVIVTITLHIVGFALLAYFEKHPPADLDLKANADRLFPRYIGSHLPIGVAGLVVAAMFAAAMSSIDSGVNSITAVAMTDGLDRFGLKPKTEKGHVRTARLLALSIGLIVVLGSTFMKYIEGNITAVTNKTVNLLTTPIFALFFFAVFSKRASTRGVWIGAFFGTLTAGAIAFSGPLVYLLHTQFGLDYTAFNVELIQKTDKVTGETWMTAEDPISFQWIGPIALSVNIATGYAGSLLFPRKDKQAK
eukprot:g33053.t1